MGFGAHVRCVAEEFGLPQPMTVPLWLTRRDGLAAMRAPVGHS
ncbi:hypothetical protein [Streptomyces cyaneochromogenes]|nr:hypothetical protein [Streptomyces cyaneochromogenes]